MRVPVARVDDFVPGESRVVEVGRRSIGVFRLGDEFFAISNYCPHQGGPLCRGRVAPAAVSQGPGDVGVAADTAFIACPWHGWEYDIATGQSYFGPGEAPVRSYGVSIERGEDLPELAGAGRTPGPYVAETFDVVVEDEYVVIDTRPKRPPQR